jgi:hypothetical protein
MFWFTKKPSSGSHSQYLAKTTHLVQCGYMELAHDVVSVMAVYYYCYFNLVIIFSCEISKLGIGKI